MNQQLSRKLAIDISQMLATLLLTLIILSACKASDELMTDDVPAPIQEVPSVVPVASSPAAIPTVEHTLLPEPTMVFPVNTPIVLPTEGPVVASSTRSIPTETIPAVLSAPAGTARMELSELSESVCVLNSSGTDGWFGTAPAPTVTPIPSNEIVEPGDSPFRDQYLARAQAIVDNSFGWSSMFESIWAYDLDINQQAAALSVLEHRMAELCNAVELIEPSADLLRFQSLMRESIRARHSWAVIATEDLLNLNSAQNELMDIRRVSTHELVNEVRSELIGVSGGEVGTEKLQRFDTIDLNIPVPAGWNVLGAQRSPIISAGHSSQLFTPDGFGPENWGKGVALRVRRFRSTDDLELNEALDRFRGLTSLLGDEVESFPSTLFGFDSLEVTVENVEAGWVFGVLFTVIDGYVYIVDLGCPLDNLNWCSELKTVAAGMSITSN